MIRESDVYGLVTDLGNKISSVTTIGTHENATISGSTINIPNLWPRVWEPLGTIMTPDLVADGNNLQEPCVIYEGSPQIITDATNVYKMLFTAGGATQNIMYAESVDGQIWTRRSTISIAGHARTYLLKVGSTYYCFCAPQSGGFSQIDVYSSSDMLTWTLAAAAIITTSGSAGWNHQSLANMAVYYDGTTFHMLLSANAVGGGPYTTGYYHSTSITSGWTAYGSNPVMGNTTNLMVAPGYLTKIGSTYYAWVFGGTTTGNLPTDIYRYHSSDMQTWVADNGASSTYTRVTGDEGAGQSSGQVGNPCLVEVSGKTHLFYSAVTNGSGLAPGCHFKHAIANYTIANLINTNEGNGSALNYSQPQAYSRVASDLNYLPNATNVGSNGTWTTGTALIQDDSGWGLRLRSVAAPTTLSYLLPAFIYLSTTGHQSYIQGASSSMNINAYGGINFQNGSGSGASSLGSFDNTGLLTTTAGVTTTGGSGFNFSSPAFGAANNLGIALRNQTAATSGIPSRWSPAFMQDGTAWTGSASQLIQFNQILKPVSGTNPVTYNYEWTDNINFAGDVTRMQLNSGGDLKLTRSIGSTEITFANAPASPYTGQEVNFSDATVNTWGTNITTGGGSNHVHARWNGSNWTVMGI